MSTWEITVSIGDAKGKFSKTSISLPFDVPLDLTQSFALEYARLVEKITNGNIGSWNIIAPTPLDFTGMKPFANSSADNEEQGFFYFKTTGANDKKISVASFPDSKIIPGDYHIDTSDEDIAAFIAAVTSGIDIGGTLVKPCDYRGEDIIGLESAYETFKNFGSKKRRFF